MWSSYSEDLHSVSEVKPIFCPLASFLYDNSGHNLPVLMAEFLLSRSLIVIACISYSHQSSTLLYHFNIAHCQRAQQGEPLLCAPTGKVFRAAELAEGPGCCIFSCLESPSVHQALHLLSKEWDLQRPASQEVPKRAHGESPREEQGEPPSQTQSWVSTDAPSSVNG